MSTTRESLELAQIALLDAQASILDNDIPIGGQFASQATAILASLPPLRLPFEAFCLLTSIQLANVGVTQSRPAAAAVMMAQSSLIIDLLLAWVRAHLSMELDTPPTDDPTRPEDSQ